MLCPAVTYNEDILPMYYVLLYRVNIGVGGGWTLREVYHIYMCTYSHKPSGITSDEAG